MLWKCYVAYLSRLGTTKLGSSLAICWFPSETGNSVWGASTSLCTPSKMLMGLGTLGIPWDTTVFHYYCYVHIYSYMIVGKMLKFDLFFFQTKHLFIPSWACMYLIYFVLCCIYFIYLSIYHSKGEHEAVVRRLHTVILGMNVPKKVSRAVLVCSNRATKFGKLWQTAVKC